MEAEGLATETLGRGLFDGEAAIARHRAAQRCLVRELDRRRVALRDGCRSLAEWVTGRMDIAPETASVVVSTVRRLGDLPDVDHAAATDVIRFDRAVAVARCAGRGDSCDILAEMAGHDLAGIRHRATPHRRMTRIDEEYAFNTR